MDFALILFFLISIVAPLTVWCQMPTDGREITGRLISQDSVSDCELNTVELEITELQTMATAHTDSTWNFRFSKVPAGSYVIHVNVDGYEEVRTHVDLSGRFSRWDPR